MNDEETNRTLRIKLNPTYPARVTQKRARRGWGQGLMSSLPLAEFVLLAGFLMAIGLVVGSEEGDTAKVPPEIRQDIRLR